MVDVTLLSQGVIRPIQRYERPLEPAVLAQAVVEVPGYTMARAALELAQAIAGGQAVLVCDGYREGLILDATKVAERNIERAASEDVLIGPHDSFSESLDTNLALLRKRLSSPNLKHKLLNVGRVSSTGVAVLYVAGIVNDKLVEEVLERIERLDIDHLYARSLMDYICDSPLGIMPNLRQTERPPRAVAALLEGRVIVMTDGEPGALIIPSFAPEVLQSAEDYYERPVVATYLHGIRLLGMMITTFLPGLWVAAVGFHHGILPPTLFRSIQAAREGVPLPTVVEMFVLLIAFDIIVEASTRMPMRVGQALGIVGGIILGQAAVEAGFVSPGKVIIVSLTGLANFTQPSPAVLGPLRLLKYGVLVVCSLFGLFGATWCIILIALQNAALRSFGYPYMYPLSPFAWRGALDVLMRVPLYWQTQRPTLQTRNVRRMGVTKDRGKRRDAT
jgi:spore germination protein KA